MPIIDNLKRNNVVFNTDEVIEIITKFKQITFL